MTVPTPQTVTLWNLKLGAGVLGWRCGDKVLRVHAMARVANVVNDMARRDRADEQFIRYAMCVAIRTAASVSLCINTACPKPVVFLSVNAFPKELLEWLGPSWFDRTIAPTAGSTATL